VDLPVEAGTTASRIHVVERLPIQRDNHPCLKVKNSQFATASKKYR
jgi:hypothetical protein